VKRIILFLFLFLYSFASWAIEPIWSDEPIAYRRNFVVSTYFISSGMVNLFGVSGYYTTYIFDTSPQAVGSYRQIIHCVMSQTEEFARTAHEQARVWLVQRFATLRVETDLVDTQRVIQTPVAPSQRTRVPFDFGRNQEPPAPGPEITPDEGERKTQSEPTTATRKRKLEEDAAQQEETKMRVFPDQGFQEVTPPPTLPSPPSLLPRVNKMVPVIAGGSW
jgi:hypothetical protein